MYRLALILSLVIATPAWAAPLLSWDAVTTGSDGSPLGTGLAVTTYNVYRCAMNVSPCTKVSGTKVATITAPTISYDLAGTPAPSNYVITAVNIVGESADSVPLKVLPPDVPKNPKIQ